MAGAKPNFGDVTYMAGENLSSSRYAVVVAGNPNECKLPAAAGAGRILGVLQNSPASGLAARVRIGFSKVVAAGNIAYGDELEIANAAGDVRVYTQDGDNGRVGRAEETAVDNDIFMACIMPIDISQLLS